MAKIPRRLQKIFANAATDVGKFGGAKAGDKTPVTDIAAIQSLPAFEGGFASATYLGNQGSQVPERNEIDGLFKVCTQQLAYILQEGVPEWDATTRYYLNSIVKSDDIIYIAIQGDAINDNTNKAVTDVAWWLPYSSIIQAAIKANATETSAGVIDNKFLTPASLADSTRRTFRNIVKFTANGTYTPSSPSVKLIKVHVVGGGGGGGNVGGNTENGGGAAGAEAKVLFLLSNITTPVPITIGAGGAPGASGSASSFGTYITCPGGNPGLSWDGGSNDIAPTIANFTTIYMSTRGNPGEGSKTRSGPGDGSGGGASSSLGGGGRGTGQIRQPGQSGEANTGAGGSGRAFSNNTPGAGGSGIVIIEEYE